jgi:putative aldouronate transport system substrate-binding protein
VKKLFSLLLALLMLLALFAGCTGNSEPTPDAGTPVSASPIASTTPITTNEGNGTILGYPIVEDSITFTLWSGGFNSANIYGFADNNDYPAYQELEKRTNVHIDWILVSSADAQSSFSLTLASQTYPDSFQCSSTYWLGGLDSYIEDDVIIDIKELARKYCPDYYGYYQSADDFRKGLVTDSGYMPGFYAIMKEKEGSWLGPVVRADLYDSYGRPDPVTLDDVHDYLAFMKNEYNLAGPMLFTQNGVHQSILSAWNIESGLYVVDNKVMYGAVQPEFKEYLTMMSQWYAEGLIDQEFYTKNTLVFMPDYKANVVKDEYVYFDAMYPAFDTLKQSAENPNYKLRATRVPVLVEGQQRLIRDVTMHEVIRIRANALGTITTACESPELLARWYNYFFTEEGFILSNYGVDEAHYIDNEGKPQFTDLILKSPEGFTATDAISKYAMPVSIVKVYDWTHQLLPTLSKEALEATKIWDTDYVETRTLPTLITLTADESTRYSALYTDINTYVTECIPAFITGQKSIDEFDTFCNQLYTMGLEEMISYQQAALNRYNAR